MSAEGIVEWVPYRFRIGLEHELALEWQTINRRSTILNWNPYEHVILRTYYKKTYECYRSW